MKLQLYPWQEECLQAWFSHQGRGIVNVVTGAGKTVMALSGGAMGGISAGIVTGVQTGDMEQALKAAALAGSEGYKWGAITGVISGGASEAMALKGATTSGLTMNQAATIQ